MQIEQLVQMALTALMRGDVPTHLLYCDDAVLVEQIVGGVRQESLHGKVAYARLLEKLPPFEAGSGYDLLGHDTASSALFPVQCPQASTTPSEEWQWVRAVIWHTDPLQDDALLPPFRQQVRLCVGVADGRIGVLEYSGGDAQDWQSTSHKS